MASLNDIHDAIATAVAAVTVGDRVLRTSAYPNQGATPPMAWPQLSDWTPATFGKQGFKTYGFDLFVFTAPGARPQDGYRPLIDLADSSSGGGSIEQAIWEANDQSAGTFGGLANTEVVVREFRVLGSYEVDAVNLYGGVFTLAVATKGV